MFDKNRKDSGMLPVCREDIAMFVDMYKKSLMANLVKKLMEIVSRLFSRSSRGLGLDFCARKLALF